MKLTINSLGKAVGDARLDFYRFYTPSWAEPAKLEIMRTELERPYAAAKTPAQGACVLQLRRTPLAPTLARRRWAHAA